MQFRTCENSSGVHVIATRFIDVWMGSSPCSSCGHLDSLSSVCHGQNPSTSSVNDKSVR
jgi:hypothetical protein